MISGKGSSSANPKHARTIAASFPGLFLGGGGGGGGGGGNKARYTLTGLTITVGHRTISGQFLHLSGHFLTLSD